MGTPSNPQFETSPRFVSRAGSECKENVSDRCARLCRASSNCFLSRFAERDQQIEAKCRPQIQERPHQQQQPRRAVHALVGEKQPTRGRRPRRQGSLSRLVLLDHPSFPPHFLLIRGTPGRAHPCQRRGPRRRLPRHETCQRLPAAAATVPATAATPPPDGVGVPIKVLRRHVTRRGDAMRWHTATGGRDVGPSRRDGRGSQQQQVYEKLLAQFCRRLVCSCCVVCWCGGMLFSFWCVRVWREEREKWCWNTRWGGCYQLVAVI